MNRQKYLDQASLANFRAQHQWLGLAQAVITTEDVKAASAQLEDDIRRHRRVANWASYVQRGGVVLSAAAMLSLVLLNELLGQLLHPALMTLFSFVVVLALAWALDSRVEAQDGRISMLRALKPIAGTDSCEKALELVKEGHAGVLAWRDLAIAERGQLHHFDVGVMSCLAHQAAEMEKAERAARYQVAAEEERKHRLDEACRIVHGI
jgi:hypothetical protein